MKHCFKPVPSDTKPDMYFAECSISGYRVINAITTSQRLFKTAAEVDSFSDKNVGEKMSEKLFKECANALTSRFALKMLWQDPCYSGFQNTYRIDTPYGPAQVTPVDGWVIFQFMEPDGKSFPCAMSSKPGCCNLHSSGGDLSALLEELADTLALVTKPIPDKDAKEQRREVLPASVMKSQAGFYVGSWVRTDEGDFPHSRYSDYFRKREDAEKCLGNGLEQGVF